MIHIHRITPLVQNMDAFYVRYPATAKVAKRVSYKGINFEATPLRVHEDPNAELPWVGKWIWHLPGEDMYFTTDIQAHSVFYALYGRGPDRGTELRSIELTQSVTVTDSTQSKPNQEPN